MHGSIIVGQTALPIVVGDHGVHAAMLCTVIYESSILSSFLFF